MLLLRLLLLMLLLLFLLLMLLLLLLLPMLLLLLLLLMLLLFLLLLMLLLLLLLMLLLLLLLMLLLFFTTFPFGMELQIGVHDIAYLPSQATFLLILLKSGNRGNGLVIHLISYKLFAVSNGVFGVRIVCSSKSLLNKGSKISWC